MARFYLTGLLNQISSTNELLNSHSVAIDVTTVCSQKVVDARIIGGKKSYEAREFLPGFIAK